MPANSEQLHVESDKPLAVAVIITSYGRAVGLYSDRRIDAATRQRYERHRSRKGWIEVSVRRLHTHPLSDAIHTRASDERINREFSECHRSDTRFVRKDRGILDPRKETKR